MTDSADAGNLTLGLEAPATPAATERVEVEPAVLVWARKSIGLDVERAARKIGVVPRTLERWESGEALPTIKQLRKAAAAYKRPLAVLLLSAPAKDFDALRDFRAGSAGAIAVQSPELTAEYWRALSQREVLIEIGDLGSLPPSEARDPARIALDMPAEDAGERIRHWLGMEATTWPEPRAALSAWIESAEAQGVLVVQTNRVPMAEMRGFSVSTWPHPVVALNGSDSVRGRLFTLAHELAHLALNVGGLCDLNEQRRGDQVEDRLERFCNRASAASLMPRAAVMAIAAVARATPGTRWTPGDLESMAKPFGTSAEAMLLRLVSLEKADWYLYWDLRPRFDDLYAAARERQREAGGGPSYYVVKARDLGHAYVRAVISAFRSRTISSLDAAEYLDVRYNQIQQLERAAG